MSYTVVLQAPPVAAQLFILLHGYGATPEDLLPVGEALAAQFPQAAVVSLGAPDENPAGFGYEWFDLQGITETNRAERIAKALPRFKQLVQGLQAEYGVKATHTALLGFSQGGMMALEASRHEALAARVFGLSSRMGELPTEPLADATYHLIHGKSDAVIHYQHCVALAETLVALGNDVTADVIPFLEHTIDEEVIALIIKQLTSYIPKKIWAAAMQAAQEEDRATRH